MKGLISTSWKLKNSQRAIKYRIENIVKSIIINIYGAIWSYGQDHLVIYISV